VERRAARQAGIGQAVAAAVACAAERPDAGARELSAEDLAALRCLLDRALQPVRRFDGFDVIDQFQTSALRYQINLAGYALAEIQCAYAPNFHGYLSRAQRNLIEKYLQKKVWSYWLYETAWGHLSLRNFDPTARDNVMLTGWFGLQVGMYMLASGDNRYAEPGSLPFNLSAQTEYRHDIHSLSRSVRANFEAAPFCLHPGGAYPICDHCGLASLAVNDALFGGHEVADVRERWLETLDAEFTDESGSIVGLRSGLTGLQFPFPGGELGFASFMNCFAPERAWRTWAVARSELGAAIEDGPSGPRFRMAGKGFDFGNYHRGWGGAYAAILATAREFGDEETADAAQRSLDLDAGRREDGGVLRYEGMSSLMNATAMIGRVRRRGDFRAAVTQGPPASALRGPLLAEAAYPEVLVAKALSSSGEDLDLVLRNGAAAGPQRIGLSRLRPQATYMARGAREGAFIADARGCADGPAVRGRAPSSPTRADAPNSP
jgi:hypothetical protein